MTSPTSAASLCGAEPEPPDRRVHNAQPELGAFGLLDPDAQDLLGAIGQDAEFDVDGLVSNKAFVPDLDADGFEEDQRIANI